MKIAEGLRLPVLPAGRKPGERCCAPEAAPRIGQGAAEKLARDLLLLAHPVRLQILDVLARNAGRVCVCDLEAAVPVKQPTVSHHLRLMREGGLLAAERHGLWVYYRVRAEKLDDLRRRLGLALDGLGAAAGKR